MWTRRLAFGFDRWFASLIRGTNCPLRRKDVRRLRSFLVDDSPTTSRPAEHLGLAASYILVPAYGSPRTPPTRSPGFGSSKPR